VKTNQGGDPSIQHEPSTLSVEKNYFFFFAAFLAGFFAAFFLAATVLTSHRCLQAGMTWGAHHRFNAYDLSFHF
jgi:hypothetical protein